MCLSCNNNQCSCHHCLIYVHMCLLILEITEEEAESLQGSFDDTVDIEIMPDTSKSTVVNNAKKKKGGTK